MNNRRYGAAIVVTLCIASTASMAYAASPSFSKAYTASSTITAGNLVSLTAKQGNTVSPANTENATRLIGVAVGDSESLLAVNGGAGTVQVATSGQVNALVSTLNGPIKIGDQLAVSPFNGIGQKAGYSQHTIGLAQAALTENSPNTTSQTVTDSKGKQKTIKVGYVRTIVAVGLSGASAKQQEKLSLLQRVTKSLTGRTISTLRIVMSLMILLFSLVTISVLIHAAITGSLLSIGRNPLAKFSIFRALRGVFGMVAAMAIATMLAIFFLLR